MLPTNKHQATLAMLVIAALLMGCGAHLDYCRYVGDADVTPKELKALYEKNGRKPLLLDGLDAAVCPCDGRESGGAGAGNGSDARAAAPASGGAKSSDGSNKDGSANRPDDAGRSADNKVAQVSSQKVRSYSGDVGYTRWEQRNASDEHFRSGGVDSGPSCVLRKPQCRGFVVSGLGTQTQTPGIDKSVSPLFRPRVFNGNDTTDLPPDGCVPQ